MKQYFVTGTDTEIGKTHSTVALIHAAQAQGLRVSGMKPVAAGAISTSAGLRNDDAEAIMAVTGQDNYELLNPYCFDEPIAPHLAADVPIHFEKIIANAGAIAAQADVTFIEGAGGWRVPLGAEGDFADLVEQAQWPVILVVGMRLGCLNHALLTVESIQRRAKLVGWVANCLPPEQPYLQQNIQTLKEGIDAPCLGILSANVAPKEAARLLTLPKSDF